MYGKRKFFKCSLYVDLAQGGAGLFCQGLVSKYFRICGLRDNIEDMMKVLIKQEGKLCFPTCRKQRAFTVAPKWKKTGTVMTLARWSALLGSILHTLPSPHSQSISPHWPPSTLWWIVLPWQAAGAALVTLSQWISIPCLWGLRKKKEKCLVPLTEIRADYILPL